MRFRRLVTIMLTLSVVASLMALPVAAIDYSDVVAPLYIGLEDVTADLAISSNGYADCSGAAYVRSGYSVTVVMELQQKNGTWQTIKTWSKSGRSVSLNESYLSPDQVIQLLKDMEQDPKVLDDLEGLWSNGQIAVLKKALSAAAKSGVGLLEATEVVEPNPISPNESTSYSNLYHCDRDGVYLYIDAVSGQLADAIGKNEG